MYLFVFIGAALMIVLFVTYVITCESKVDDYDDDDFGV
jgi:hypothetical protein